MNWTKAACLLALIWSVGANCAAVAPKQALLGELENGVRIYSRRETDGRLAIVTEGRTIASSLYMLPVRVEMQDPVRGLIAYQQGYDRVEGALSAGALIGRGTITAGKVQFVFYDRWSHKPAGLSLDREVSVVGNGEGGFMSALVFSTATPWRRRDVKQFVPGIIYGTTDKFPENGLVTKEEYTNGHGIVRIREDRMPAPLFGVHFSDSSAVTLSDDSPKAGSTIADSNDSREWNVMQEMVDSRFQFGALGEDESRAWDLTEVDGPLDTSEDHRSHHLPEIGFWMPGTEGEMTLGDSYGQPWCCWRRRFHPLTNGFTHRYHLSVTIDAAMSFPTYATQAWRRAWTALDPKPALLNIEEARHSIEKMLEKVAIHGRAATGLPFFVSAVRGDQIPDSRYALMGFLGRNLQIADMLLYESAKAGTDAATLRSLSVGILDSFARLNMSPPESDGIWLESGQPVDEDVFLRSPCEDLYFMLSAWRREHAAGREHAMWRKRPIEFADWLMSQQTAEGGFPRGWRRNSNTIADPSTLNSYLSVPLLVEVFQVTNDPKYLAAAVRAGDFSWREGQWDWGFFGGTNDHPNVLDKEAGTWSLNAYLRLFEVTHASQWLERARAAGDYSETYIYIWNIEMPSDATDAQLPWKKEVSTVGLNLVAADGTGGADEYMSGDVANYVRLYKYTGDEHYLAVAKILLKNTKSMMALPGRTYDLVGPGWQQEAWSLSIPRNHMAHRVWLPWISAAQLAGIVQTEEFDSESFGRLSDN